MAWINHNIVNFFAAPFSTGWWMMGMGASPYAIGAVCGIAGLLGDRGLQMLLDALTKKIGGINEKEQ